MQFRVRWPDDSTTLCYSPSSTITDALLLAHPYPLQEFVERARAALQHGSNRVAEKYGFGCGQALAQIRDIERYATRFAGHASATVIVEQFL